MTATTVPFDAGKTGVMRRLLRTLKNLIIGTFMCVTPPTAVVALGWMLRDMRGASVRRINPYVDASAGAVNWIRGPREAGLLASWFGGLWRNIRTGVCGFSGLAVAALPFTALWIFSWWAGWENSFNKGYEQAWVGPVVGLTGVAISLVVLPHLPMALAHRAVERRWAALFELRRIRQLIAYAGWRYVFLAVFTVIAALPLTAARGMPVFAEQLAPQLANLPAADLEALSLQIALAKAAYIFVILVILRRWMAIVHSMAVLRVVPAATSALWRGSVVAELVAHNGSATTPAYVPWRLGRIVRAVLLVFIWFGLVAQIYISQFLNYSWWLWLSHPFVVLPWLP